MTDRETAGDCLDNLRAYIERLERENNSMQNHRRLLDWMAQNKMKVSKLGPSPVQYAVFDNNNERISKWWGNYCCAIKEAMHRDSNNG
jgi:hypothetical protein